jgi:hypothetical protein
MLSSLENGNLQEAIETLEDVLEKGPEEAILETVK